MPSRTAAVAAALACGALAFAPHAAQAAVAADEVKALPGFPGPYPMKVYSGFLNVTFSPPVNGYDGAHIHYQFHTSQRASAATDPVVAWHTGGPGGSSVYGQYAELGYFQVSTSLGETVNEHAWSQVANMLFLEAPAGSFLTPVDLHSGFSYCTKGGVRQAKCSWNDVTQAEAYAHTLAAFFEAYPELRENEFFLAGESYAGQYVPNIAAHLLETKPAGVPALKGIAVGNGCWGGDATHVNCNGPNEDLNDVNFYHGKGLISTKLYTQIMGTCDFAKPSAACEELLHAMDKAVGPHNVYNVYDNCPNLDLAAATDVDGVYTLASGADNNNKQKLPLSDWFEKTGKSPRWLRKYLAANLVNPHVYDELDAMAVAVDGELGEGNGNANGNLTNPPSGGGYDWTCGQFDALPVYFKRPEVREALHLPATSQTSEFDYDTSGPASVTLYPKLVEKIRVLIYNGDADTCVPYIGNEEWTSGLGLNETRAWHPWFKSNTTSSPTGYATTYGRRLQFVTVRLAGHQVPKNMPEAALAIITALLDDKEL